MIFDTSVFVDAAKIKRDCTEDLKRAQAPLDSAVMSDSNFFVPLKTGELQKSAIRNTIIGSGVVRWATDYARRHYYNYERPAHQENPNACAKWFEAAKARFLDKWVKIVNEYIKRG